jgi:CubicO group peptidase (beta-lactamase class C family)
VLYVFFVVISVSQRHNDNKGPHMLQRRLAFLLLLLSLLLSVAHAQQSIDFSELERAALEELKATNTPGAAIAIVKGDRLVYSKAFGVASVDTGAAVTPDMLFRLGSTTKMFTAAALVQLAEQGKIKLNEPIGNYVKDLHPRVAALTADQILSHMTGLWDEAPMYGPQDDAALAENIRKWREDRFFADAGVVYSYSNPGYWLAGFLVQELSGKRYADQVAESVLKPLGMARSTFRPMQAITYPVALGHDVTPARQQVVVRPFANNAATWPSGSLFSSVEELSRFTIAFMNDGRIDGRQVLSPTLIATLSSPHANIPAAEQKYGYGLMLSTQRGVRVVEHGGARSGYGSNLRMFPDQKVAIILAVNRSGGNLGRTMEKAMELTLPLEPRKQPAVPQSIAMNEAEMVRLAGTYSQGASKIEILVRDGKLYAQQGPRQLEVLKLGGEKYAVSVPGAPTPPVFALIPGPDGKTMFLHQGGRTLRRQE